MSPNPPDNKYGGQMPVTLVGQNLTASSCIDIRNHLAHWNVTLSPLIRADGAPIQGEALFATIAHRANVQWGHGGMQDLAEVDWPLRGGTFQVAGSSLNVWGTCLLQGLSTSAGSNQIPQVNFRAHASPADGARASLTQPTRTLTFGNMLATTTSALQRVPSFARRVYYQTSNTLASGADFLANFYNHALVPILVRQDTYAPSAISFGVYTLEDLALFVPDDAMWIEIVAGAVDLTDVRAIFELDLG